MRITAPLTTHNRTNPAPSPYHHRTITIPLLQVCEEVANGTMPATFTFNDQTKPLEEFQEAIQEKISSMREQGLEEEAKVFEATAEVIITVPSLCGIAAPSLSHHCAVSRYEGEKSQASLRSPGTFTVPALYYCCVRIDTSEFSNGTVAVQ